MIGLAQIREKRWLLQELQSRPDFKQDFRFELFLLKDQHCSAYKVAKINGHGDRVELRLKIYWVQSEQSGQHYLKAAQNEAKMLKTIKNNSNDADSRYIVNIKDHDWVEPKQPINERFIVMEYCPNGSLEDFVLGLQRRGEWLSVDELFYLVQQLVKAVHHMHSTLKIMHRNIKLSNIYFDADFEVKITDFKFSRGCTNLQEVSAEKVGACQGMPPEIHNIPQYVEPGEDQQYCYNEKVDIYRLGVVIHYLAYGSFPQRSQQYQWRMPQDEYLKVAGTPQQKQFIIAFLSNCLSAVKDRHSSESWVQKISEAIKVESRDMREQLRSKKNLYLAHLKKMFYIEKEEKSLYLIILSNRRAFLLIEKEKEKQTTMVQIFQTIRWDQTNPYYKLIPKEYYEFMDQWKREASYDDYAGDTTHIQSVLLFTSNAVFLELSNSVMHHCFRQKEETKVDQFKTIISMRLNRLQEHEIIIGVPAFTPLQIYSSFQQALKSQKATEYMEYIRGRYLKVFKNESVKLRKERNLVRK